MARATVFLLAAGTLALPAATPAAFAQAAVKPLATGTTNWEGVSIDLMSVERKGNVLTVKWAVRNQAAKPTNVRFAYTGTTPATYVVDEESGTKYYVLTDKEKKSLASQHEYIGSEGYGINDDVPAGGTNRYWMKLPAPPPQVKAVSIFFTNSEPFEGVAITDR